MKIYYALFLLVLPPSEVFATEVPFQVGCRIVETQKGDFKNQVTWNQKVDFTFSEVPVPLRAVKGLSFSVMGAGGMIGKTKKLEISVVFVDQENGGARTTSIVLLKPAKVEESGDLTVIFTRANKDSVGVTCELVDKASPQK